MPSAFLDDADRAVLAELAPVVRRAVDLDTRAVARLRLTTSVATVLVRLPFGVLVSRSVQRTTEDASTSASVVSPAEAAPVTHPADAPERDLTVGAREFLGWLDGTVDATPPARDADWRGGLPPVAGWQRLETVPDTVLRPLVRQGALTLKDAAEREGLPGAQPRQEVADVLLDSVVLDVHDAGARAEVTLRALSALTRMGFLARGGQAHVDVAGRWIRVVGGYGTVYLERPGGGLGLVR